MVGLAMFPGILKWFVGKYWAVEVWHFNCIVYKKIPHTRLIILGLHFRGNTFYLES